MHHPIFIPVGNKTMSQRDVYYSSKWLFKSQATCNTRILETGLTLGLKRCECDAIAYHLHYVAFTPFHQRNPDEMNIAPTSKGEIATMECTFVLIRALISDNTVPQVILLVL